MKQPQQDAGNYRICGAVMLRPECTPPWVSEKLAAVQARRREDKQR